MTWYDIWVSKSQSQSLISATRVVSHVAWRRSMMNFTGRAASLKKKYRKAATCLFVIGTMVSASVQAGMMARTGPKSYCLMQFRKE